MSGDRLLLDTNIILYLLNGDEVLADFLQGIHVHISFITELELLSFQSFQTEEHLKIEQLLQQVTIIDFSEDIKAAVKTIRSQQNIKLPDAIIAATAIVKNFSLLSADKGFEKVEEINNELNFILYKK